MMGFISGHQELLGPLKNDLVPKMARDNTKGCVFFLAADRLWFFFRPALALCPSYRNFLRYLPILARWVRVLVIIRGLKRRKFL